MEKELPNNWVEAKLKHLGTYINGRAFKPTEWKSEGLPIIRIQNLNNHNAIFNYSDGQFEEKFKVYDGDLLMSWSASLGVYFWQRGDAWLNQHIFKVVNNETLISKGFLFYCLLISIEDFYNKTHGTGIVHITKPVFENHEISLPPLSEQSRIVAKLDSLFAQLESIKTSMAKIPVLLRNFRQQILTQAVTGKLTEEWREGKNLEEWNFIELDKFCKDSFYGPRFSKDDYTEEGFPTVRTTDMSDDGRIVLSNEIPKIKIDDPKKIELYKVNKGDLLITRTGSIGKMARYFENTIVIPSAYLVRFRFNDLALTDYVYYCLISPYGQNQMGLNAIAVTQPNLNAQKIKAIKIPDISIVEQQEIVSRVESLFAKADAIEEKYKNLKAKIETLPQTILHKAFKGELTEQLETDGDAKVLLEEIVALKNSEKPKKVIAKKYVQPDDEVLRIVAEPAAKDYDTKVEKTPDWYNQRFELWVSQQGLAARGTLDKATLRELFDAMDDEDK